MDYAKKNKPKREQLLKLLSDLRWHPHYELRNRGGIRYSARLLELKRLGYLIEDRRLSEQGKEYRLRTLKRGALREKKVKVYLRYEDAENLLEGTMSNNVYLAVEQALQSYRANRNNL